MYLEFANWFDLAKEYQKLTHRIDDLRWGRFALMDCDLVSGVARLFGEWSDVEIAFLHTLLEPTDNIIEVGSNLGLHAVPLAKAIPQGVFIGFEPQQVIFEHLSTNLRLNQLDHALCFCQGVGDKNAWLEIETSNYQTQWNYGSFSLDKGFSTEHQFPASTQTQKVQIVTLDTHPQVAKLQHLKLLKMDAEGYETRVLDGAKSLIDRFRPLIFTEMQFKAGVDIWHKMTQMDYECYWFASCRYQSDNYRQIKAEDLPKGQFFEFGYDANAICIPKELAFRVPSYLQKIQSEHFEGDGITLKAITKSDIYAN